jgi:hypothetical protein
MTSVTQYNSLPDVFHCKICNYYTCNTKNWDKHLVSRKHTNNGQIQQPVIPIIEEKPLQDNTNTALISSSSITCECCGKQYKNKTGLTRHIKYKDRTQQEQATHKTNNNDNEALVLISDESCSGSDSEMEETNIEYDSFTMNRDVMYFLYIQMHSIDFIQNICMFINRVCSFFSLRQRKYSE